jgi:hypothetical protein
MPRTIGVFRKACFPVELYPVDWRTRCFEDVLHPFATMSDGLRRTDSAVHEWVGLKCAYEWLSEWRVQTMLTVPTQKPPFR